MEHIKNDSLFTYIDSIETQDFFSNYKLIKIPKLNHYAEMYLENLEKEKLNKEMNCNNDSKDNINLNMDNINDNASSIKGLSNDITNNDSIINTNFQINKIRYAHNKNESSESNNFKSINYLAIEKLKENIQDKLKNSKVISKVNTLTIIQDNKNKKILPNQKNNNETRKTSYKKIIPLQKNKIESRLFFNFKESKPVKLEEKAKFSNSNKTQYNLCFRKSNNIFNYNSNNIRNKTLLNNNNEIRLNKIKKYYPISPLFQLLSNNRKNTNKNIRIKLINSFTENSQCDSISTKNTKNKIYSITLNDYWKEKEIKKRIKLAKLKEEKTLKELGQLRDKPKINKNSRKIAERLGSNNSSTVFERLSESCNKILFNERKINLLTRTSKNKKAFKWIEQITNSRKTDKNLELNLNSKTIKQSRKKDTNNNINKIRYNTIKNEKKTKKIQDKIKNYYKTEFLQKSKVQKIKQRNKLKAQTNRIDNKYINKYKPIDRQVNVNKNEDGNLLYDNDILCNTNSAENIIRNKNKINDKVKYLLKNKRLKIFLNKNKSSRNINVKREETSERKTFTKINKQTELLNKKDKNISQISNEEAIFEDKIKKEKEISEFNLSSYESNENKNITNKNINSNNNILIGKNGNKNNNKRNSQIKNTIINLNSFNNIINNKTRYSLNISKNQTSEENCMINRRKMDLLKVLNFSSNIRINYKFK